MKLEDNDQASSKFEMKWFGSSYSISNQLSEIMTSLSDKYSKMLIPVHFICKNYPMHINFNKRTIIWETRHSSEIYSSNEMLIKQLRMHNVKNANWETKNILWKIMKHAGEKIKRVILYKGYGDFQKEDIAIDFILIVVIQWKFKYSFKVLT